MVDTFVPLMPGNSAAATEARPGPYRLKIMPPAPSSPAFQPLAPKPAPPPPAGSPQHQVLSAAPKHDCARASADQPAPKVTLIRSGDQVTHIRVECGCGQVVELECIF